VDREEAVPTSTDELVSPNRRGRTVNDAADLLRRATPSSHRVDGHRQRLATRSQPFNDFSEQLRILEFHVLVVAHP